MSYAPFALNPLLDVARLAETYRRRRRVRIDGLLAADGAERLRAHLVARTDWRQVLNSGDKFFELDRATRASMSPAQRAALDEAVAAGARHGFQYRYEALRVADSISERARAADLLATFAQWLYGPAPLALLSSITGSEDIVFADAQATAYAPGDLLTAHDDEVAGKDRRAAYVLGLNPAWRPEWGGLLLFHDNNGTIRGVSPGFNTLDLLAVPQPHSVSYVTASAAVPRYSVTGWLRAQKQPR